MLCGRAPSLLPVVALLPWLLLACGPDDGGAVGTGAADEPPRTLVLVTLDTLRADHLPWHGHPRDTAPYLSSLAGESLVFLAAESSSSHTGPSHGTMFTGLYPSQHGLLVNGAELGEGVVTVTEQLAAAGWTTAAFTSVGFLQGLSRGFDHVDASTIRQRRAAGEGRHSDHRSARDTVARALAWLAMQPDDEPLFLWVHLFDVHGWVQGGPEDERQALLAADARRGLDEEALLDLLLDQRGLRPAAFVPDAQGRLAGLRRPAPGEAPGPRAPGGTRRDLPGAAALLDAVHSYDARIRVVDGEVRRLHQALLARGPTTLVLTSDHGEGLGARGVLTHGRHVQGELVRVPLLIHDDRGRLPTGERHDLVHHVDLPPTLRQLAGLPPAAEPAAMADRALAGRSLLAAPEPGRLSLAQRRPADDDRIQQNGWWPGAVLGLGDGRLRLIHRAGGDDALYDLAADPLELSPLPLDDGPHAAAAERLLVLLARQLQLMASQTPEGAGDIDAAHLEELRQLGYLR